MSARDRDYYGGGARGGDRDNRGGGSREDSRGAGSNSGGRYSSGDRGARHEDRRYGNTDRPRSRSRSRERRRDVGGDGDRQYYGGGRSSGGGQYPHRDGSNSDDYRDRDRGGDYESRYPIHNVSSTVIVKGLPSHTTEPTMYAALAAFSPQSIRLISSRETGECKGFAFVEFYSSEYAEYFMKTYAGSCGDPRAPQFIVENRALTLDYARDDQIRDPSSRPPPPSGSGSGRGGASSGVKTDWLCDSCGCQNFARRTECYRCSVPKSSTAIAISIGSNTELPADPSQMSETPSSTLVVKGLPPLATEDQISETFRQYATVSNVLVMRDWATGVSRGIAFVEFHTVEHAVHAKNQSSQLVIGKHQIKVGFARPGYQKFFQTQNASSHNPYAAAALQVAQWSTNNAYVPAPIPVNSTFPPAIPHKQATLAVPKLRLSRIWPSNFETEGGAYHFQPQSGCFLDPLTQFYYCPKSKSYYSALTGEYFRYVGGSNPETMYAKINIPEPTGDASELTKSGSDLASSSGVSSDKSRKPLVISLGGFGSKKPNKPIASIESSNPSAHADASAVPSTLLTNSNTVLAKVSENMQKWEERRRKEDMQVEPAEAGSQSRPRAGSIEIINNVEFTSNNDKSESETATSKPATIVPIGPPVCLLCRRQFPSVDVLKRHEKESKLHSDNLAKAAADAAEKGVHSANDGGKYRDRASERRALHPPEEEDKNTSGKEKRVSTAATEHNNSNSSVVPTAVETPPESLDQDFNNPGNLLLRRMGWTDGEGLGKDSSGSVIPVALIEKVVTSTLAPGQKTGIGVAEKIPSLIYGDSKEYKESLLKATKARFDASDKSGHH